jgi:hypothetical protein
VSVAARWLGRFWPRRYRRVQALRQIQDGKVQVSGRVEPLGTIDDPLTGEPCVAIEYRAWPPSTTIGMDGATTHSGRAFQLEARQAVEFLLADATASILVRPPMGEDVDALHRDLLHRYGVALRAETSLVPAGAQIHLEGRVSFLRGTGSPLRSEPYVAIVEAERFWLTTPG